MINSKIIKMSQILSNKLKKSKKMKIKLKIKNMQFQKIKYQCLEDQYNKVKRKNQHIFQCYRLEKQAVEIINS